MKMTFSCKFYIAVLLLTIATSCGQSTDSENKQNADIIIQNARIFTSNIEQPWAEALAVKNGKFIYVGDAVGINDYQSETSIDFQGQLMIPGMVDGHAHPG